MHRQLSWILAAALVIAVGGSASAQTSTPPDPGAAANVRQSQQYEEVRRELMRPTEHHTRCPYKGEAAYWTIELPGDAVSNRRSENAVWAYPSPYDEVSGLAGYYAFYPNRVDAIMVT